MKFDVTCASLYSVHKRAGGRLRQRFKRHVILRGEGAEKGRVIRESPDMMSASEGEAGRGVREKRM